MTPLHLLWVLTTPPPLLWGLTTPRPLLWVLTTPSPLLWGLMTPPSSPVGSDDPTPSPVGLDQLQFSSSGLYLRGFWTGPCQTPALALTLTKLWRRVRRLVNQKSALALWLQSLNVLPLHLFVATSRMEGKKEGGRLCSKLWGWDERLHVWNCIYTFKIPEQTIAVVRPKLVSFRRTFVFSMLGLQNLWHLEEIPGASPASELLLALQALRLFSLSGMWGREDSTSEKGESEFPAFGHLASLCNFRRGPHPFCVHNQLGLWWEGHLALLVTGLGGSRRACVCSP